MKLISLHPNFAIYQEKNEEKKKIVGFSVKK